MSTDLISPRTRLKFREYFVGTSVAAIDDAFALACIKAREDYNPPVSGVRRGRVEQYYANLDFSKRPDVRQILIVYEHAISELQRQVKYGNDHERTYAAERLDEILQCLRRDGFDWIDGRLVEISKTAQLRNLQDAISMIDAPELDRQLSRLRDAVDEDPGLAIGTAKDMLETTCKTILDDLWIPFDPTWDLPELLRLTRKELKLLPTDIPDSIRAETIRKLLGSLGQIGHGLAELRNLYGSGHGRLASAKGLSARHARLAVGSVATLVQFLFDTHGERKRP